MTTFYFQFLVGLAGLLGFLWLLLRPDVLTVQRGYRGTGMELNLNLRTAGALEGRNQAPEVDEVPPAIPVKAGDVYENVKVLGHVPVNRFGRLMNAISEWVVPADWVARTGESQNCNYCHNPNNMGSDEKYTKVVARRMLQMTQTINGEWKAHVGETGVTCYTCHRGNAVPEYLWFVPEPGRNEFAFGMGTRAGQNQAGREVGSTSLPTDPFSPFLLEERDIRVIGQTPLPSGNRHSIKQAEWTYGLMMHMSNALGVNCTYCHNTRSMAEWGQSPPPRAKAWHGIRMVRTLNQGFLNPLLGTYPEHRLGPTGDAPKANCATCHQGAFIPLLGAQMLTGYPSLSAPGPQEEVSVLRPAAKPE